MEGAGVDFLNVMGVVVVALAALMEAGDEVDGADEEDLADR